MKQVLIMAAVCLCLGLADAQPFKGFAADMAMSNLHNELEQRRQRNAPRSETPRYDQTTKNYASLLLLNWMVANQTETLPDDAYVNAMMRQAQLALEGAGVYDSRNLEIDVMLFTKREFEELHAAWQATSGNAAAEKDLSDKTWRSFKANYGLDLRAVSIEELTGD